MKRNSLTTRELRKFGLVMAAPLTLIGGVLLWRGRTAGMILLGLAGLFLLLAGVAPRALAPVERYWMAFAERLGAVMTRVILTLTFYLVITPIGLLLRVMGKDLLHLRDDRDRESFWEPAEPGGPAERPERPY